MNQRLFELGSEVVRLRQQIEKNNPEPTALSRFLWDLLELVNQIRIASYDEENEINKEPYKKNLLKSYKVFCEDKKVLVLADAVKTNDGILQFYRFDELCAEFKEWNHWTCLDKSENDDD